MIVIVDFGMGNIGSIANMLKKIGAECMISSSPADIEKADKLILPGVGAFDNAINNLNKLGLVEVLNKRVLGDKVPILGICLGMQLLTKRSEEGNLPGLGWIDAETVRFRFEGDASHLKVPHMGWNQVKVTNESTIFTDVDKESRYYFVHSYHLKCDRAEDVLSTTHYGYDFASAVRKGNVIGTQFHPEKSHKFGLQLLVNFTKVN